MYAEPNPVGVGQTVFISLFFTKPIPVVGAAGGASLYTGLTLNIIKPDGTNQSLGPYVSDTTGGVGGIEFVPTTTGNYSVQAFYKGQTISGTVSGAIVTYNILPTQSDTITFTVQHDPIPGTVLTPLPSEYWSRPIYATNYQWSQLGGNWWGLGKPSFTDTGGYDASATTLTPTLKHQTQHTSCGLNHTARRPSRRTSQRRPRKPIHLNLNPLQTIRTNHPKRSYLLQRIPQHTHNSHQRRRNPRLERSRPTHRPTTLAQRHQRHLKLRHGASIPHNSRIRNTSMASSARSKRWNRILSLQRLATIRPNDWILHRQHNKRTKHSRSGLVETKDDSPQGTVYIHTVNGTYPNLTLTMWNSTLCIVGPTGTATIRPSGNINYTRGYQWSIPIPSTIGTTNITDLSRRLLHSKTQH